MDQPDNDSHAPSFWRRPAGMALATAAVIAGFYLLREHWGHVLGYWPYLLLLACPLMHLMHGHGGYDRGLMEQRLRDVLGFQIGDGTAQIMKLIIARERIGRAAVQY